MPPEYEDDTPPPAFVESSTGSYWLRLSNYCLPSICADFAHPSERDDLPVIVILPGEAVRFHLDLDPAELMVEIVADDGSISRRVELPAEPSSDWRPAEDGAFLLFVKLDRGDVLYAGRVDVIGE